MSNTEDGGAGQPYTSQDATVSGVAGCLVDEEHDKSAFAAPNGRNRRIFLDVSDLVDWLRHHNHVSGIQRVQVEIVAALASRVDHGFEYVCAYRQAGSQDVRQLSSTLMDGLMQYLRSGGTSRQRLDGMINRLVEKSEPVELGRGDVFFLLGAFWHILGVVGLLGNLAAEGVVIGTIIYDLIPVRHPEFTDIPLIRNFSSALRGIGPLISFAFTISEFVGKDYAAYRRELDHPEIPIRTMPLAVQLDRPARTAQLAPDIAARVGSSYVLQVGTVEVRKNPRFALDIWRKLIRAGVPDLPKLVYVGRLGWRVKDFLEELEASNYLDDRVLIINGASDADLWSLYEGALFTIFPTFNEGWGLPVGESLAHGIPCICSDVASVPEVGGSFADYVDPLNVRSGLAAVQQMLDANYRDTRARQIREHYPLRPWSNVADRFHVDLIELIRASTPIVMEPTVLRAGELISLASRGAHYVPVTGFGWHHTEDWGMWGGQEECSLSFFADTAETLRVFLMLRTPPWLQGYRMAVSTTENEILEERSITRAGETFIVGFDVDPKARGRVDFRIKVTGPPLPKIEGDDRSIYIGVEAVGYCRAENVRGRQDLIEGFLLNSLVVAPRVVAS